MDRIFIEEIVNDVWRISAIDRRRIFEASNPGLLATIFECSINELSSKDRGEIFYALGESINAPDFFVDIHESYRSCTLNTWSVTCDPEATNIFSSRMLNFEERTQLYSERHTITPNEEITSTSSSLFSLISFSQNLQWKTGILQRCIDCLIFPEYRGKGKIYATIDKNYRRIMRFKLETNHNSKFPDSIYTKKIRKIVSLLGLNHSHDEKKISCVFDPSIEKYVDFFENILPLIANKNITDKISDILFIWSGSRLVNFEDGFKLEIDPNVLEGLNYIDSIPDHPGYLSILEESF